MVARVERGVAERVFPDDLEILNAVQQQIHARDRRCREHLLLAIELSPESLWAASGIPHVLDDLDEHASSPARGIVDALTLLRVEDVHEQADDRTRRVVLAGLLIRLVGEPLDEVFVCVAKHIGGNVRVAQRLRREELDEIGELAVRQLVFVRPVGVAEDAIEGLGVRLLHLAERSLQCGADVFGLLADVRPEIALGDSEAVVLGKRSELMIAARIIERLLELLDVDVADPLEEHQREDVGLEVGLVNAAAEKVGGLRKILLQLGKRELCSHL